MLSYVCLDQTRDVFSSDFSTKILYAFLIYPMRATYSSHLIHFDLIALRVQSTYYEAPKPSPNACHFFLLSPVFSPVTYTHTPWFHDYLGLQMTWMLHII
jgi:hypothetical protein